MTHRRRRIVILAEGSFNPLSAKTATGVIRYSPHEVVAVIDSTQAGRTVGSVLGYGGDVPVVAGIADTIALQPDVLLIGIAPSGGRLPDPFRRVIREALEHRLDVWNGLHFFLGNDRELADLAEKHGVCIWDVRRPAPHLAVAEGRALDARAFVVLTIGSDCNTGKMTTALELEKTARERGFRAGFVATGQTGILIEGEGTPLDAIPGDFMSGEVERLVMDLDAEGAEVIFVEGQGGLHHPGFGPVTLGLMLGAMPDAYVLSHHCTRVNYRPDYEIPIPPLPMVIRQYEQVMEYYKAPKVAAIALNTFDMTAEEARAVTERIRRETGLPAVDPIRNGVAPIWEALEPLVRAKLARSTPPA